MLNYGFADMGYHLCAGEDDEPFIVICATPDDNPFYDIYVSNPSGSWNWVYLQSARKRGRNFPYGNFVEPDR